MHNNSHSTIQNKIHKTYNKTKKAIRLHKITKVHKINKLSNKLILGCHASITPSIIDGIKYIESINGNALQIFLGNNRSANLKTKTKLTDEDILKIKTYIHEKHITLIIHSIYLLNFCSAQPYSGRIKYMHNNIQHDLKYGALIGAKCVVLHLGSKKDLESKKELESSIAIQNLIANITKIIKTKPAGIQLALETSAGQGLQIGYKLEELAEIWNGIKHFGIKHVGICIDTAHIFVSGYDISSPAGIADYLYKFNKLIGWKNITNFHINDSRYPLGSKKDEHRGIGQGLIYHNLRSSLRARATHKSSLRAQATHKSSLRARATHKSSLRAQALKYIKTFCQKRGIPMILETHGAGSTIKSTDSNTDLNTDKHGYKWEIDLIRKL